MPKFALYVPLEAKPGKEKDVADFLKSAVPLVNAEPGTVTWYAIQQGPSSFAIFDTFDDEAGRDAHLNGKVAAALMEKVKTGDLFAKTPEIHKLGIIAHKLPKLISSDKLSNRMCRLPRRACSARPMASRTRHRPRHALRCGEELRPYLSDRP